MAGVPQIILNDGTTIPQLGLGVWQVDPGITARVVRDGIAAGYRLIDTAEGYDNEEGVGEAIRTAEVPREDLYIASKLRNGAHGRDSALKAFDKTMGKLGIEQLDLFLIHWPVPGQGKYAEAWATLVELLRNVQIECYSPLGSGAVLEDETIASIGRARGKSVAQTILRWHLQQGLIVIPKSIHAERMKENFDVFDFELSDEEMAVLSGLGRGEDGRTGGNPATNNNTF